MAKFRIKTEEELVESWDRFISIINLMEEPRKSQLLKLTEDFQDVMILAPAASREHFHNSYPGGYLDHVLNVHDLAFDFAEVWKKHDKFTKFTDDNIRMVTLFHDLGKLGISGIPFYIDQEDKWRKDKMGELYKINPDIPFMNGADRSLFVLQQYGILLDDYEWIAIKIHEGLYEEGNSEYYKQFDKRNYLRNTLPLLLHQADMFSVWKEYHLWENVYSVENPTPPSESFINRKKTLSETMASAPDDTDSLKNAFEKMFENK